MINTDYWSKVFLKSRERSSCRDARLKTQSEPTSKRRQVECVKIWTFRPPFFPILIMRKRLLAAEGWTTIESYLDVVMQGHRGLSSTVFLNLQTLRPINVENLRRRLFCVAWTKPWNAHLTLLPLTKMPQFLLLVFQFMRRQKSWSQSAGSESSSHPWIDHHQFDLQEILVENWGAFLDCWRGSVVRREICGGWRQRPDMNNHLGGVWTEVLVKTYLENMKSLVLHHLAVVL